MPDNPKKRIYWVVLSDNSAYFCSEMNDPKIRSVTFYKDYFSDFFHKQKQKVKDKILWTLRIIETQQQIPVDYLKHLEGTDGLYEIRVQQGSDIFRIFCFFDEGKLIVLTNGFQKKTQKTPKSEIDKALKIKKEYEQEK
jgi:phage-related protein